MISAMNSENVVGYQMRRKGEAIKRLNVDGILNVNPQTLFDASLVLLKVVTLKSSSNSWKCDFLSEVQQRFVKILPWPQEKSREVQEPITSFSTKQFSSLSELAVMLSVINEGVIVPFRWGFRDICCLALQRVSLKSWCDSHEDFVKPLLTGSLHAR